MIFSMTGFGRGRSKWDSQEVTIEIRSVNSRYLDISIRLPQRYSVFEPRIKGLIKNRINRGRIEVSIQHSYLEGEVLTQLDLNLPLARIYHDIYKRLKSELGLRGEVDLSFFTGLKDIIAWREEEPELEKEWIELEKALTEGLDSLDEMRSKEGQAALEDLIERLGQIEGWLEEIRTRYPEVLVHFQKRLDSRVRELSRGIEIDPVRLSQEVAFFAERSDICEELNRINSHIKQFRTITQNEGPMGRKLDFLLQEIHREVNTLSAKANDAEISQKVVDMKGELEKIREQVQNIE